MAGLRPSFIDLHPTHDVGGYLVTNEAPEIHMELIKDLPLGRVASIASGGEIPLLVLLPKADVVAVDHSYRALAICYLKACVLDILGPTDTKELFTKKTYGECQSVFDKILPELPDVLRAKAPVMEHYNYAATKIEWALASISQLEQTCRRLNCLSLVHGDLTDIASMGPFDAFYASNALEHSGRQEKGTPTFESFKALIKEHGYLLLAGNPHHKGAGFKAFKEVAQKGGRTAWIHRLYQHTTPDVVTPAAVPVPV